MNRSLREKRADASVASPGPESARDEIETPARILSIS